MDEEKQVINQEEPPRKQSLVSSEGNEEAQKLEERKRQDARSIYIQNVDYKTTKEELELIFQDCGHISRITIVKNHVTGQSKGYAYMSFDREDGVEMALNFSGLKHRGRVINVKRKRTNVRGMNIASKDKNTEMIQSIMFLSQNQVRGKGKRGK